MRLLKTKDFTVCYPPICESWVNGLQGRFDHLTPREKETLPLIVAGMLNKQAAAVLGITEVTLQVHRGQIMKKMGAQSFADLVRMAAKLGIPNHDGPL